MSNIVECAYGHDQGYLFSRPMDSEGTAALIAAQPQW